MADEVVPRQEPSSRRSSSVLTKPFVCSVPPGLLNGSSRPAPTVPAGSCAPPSPGGRSHQKSSAHMTISARKLTGTTGSDGLGGVFWAFIGALNLSYY